MKNGESTLLKRFFRLSLLAERALPQCNPRIFGNCVLAVIPFEDNSRMLLAAAQVRKAFPDGLEGEMRSSQDGFLLCAPLSPQNAAVLRTVFPWAAPQRLAQYPVLWMPETFAELTAMHRPGLIAAPQNNTAAEFNDFLTFQALQTGYDDGFSLQLAVAPDQDELSPIASSHLFQLGKTEDEPGELAAEYRQKNYILDDRAALTFDDALLAECQMRYRSVPSRLNRLERQLEKVRKNDFELLLQLDAPPEQLTAHLLYLSRELRRRKAKKIVFQLPHPVRHEWIQALRFGSCSAVSIHDGVRQIIDIDNQT